jgi:peptidoglycan/xylan/chitin deacetylase (PgdA/CDA1 family)
MSRQQKEAMVAENLINAMMQIAGYELTVHDLAAEGGEWYSKYTMTREQEKQWMEWGEKYLRQTLKHTAKQAHKNMQMFNVSYGLRIKYDTSEQEE